MRAEDFDKTFKQGLDRYEAPAHTEEAWNNIEGRLAASNQKYTGSNLWPGAAAAGILLIAGAGIAYLSFQNPESPAAQNPLEAQTILPAAPESPEILFQADKTEATSPTAELVEEQVHDDRIFENPQPTDLPPTEMSVKPQVLMPCIRLNKEIICSGEWVEVQTDYCAPNTRYLITWNGNPLLGSNQKLRMTREGENRLDLHLIENGKTRLLQSKTVVVHPKTKAAFNIDDNVKSEEPIYIFSVKNKDAIAAVWKFDNGAVERNLNTGFMFSSKGRHRIKLTTINEHGCMDSTERSVSIKHAYNLMAATVFIPRRDTWLPAGLQKLNAPFTLTIVNQEGQIIFETNSTQKTWDGTLPLSEKAAPGEIYYWVARIQDGRNSEYGGEILIAAQ
jgi:hypothetical protein